MPRQTHSWAISAACAASGGLLLLLAGFDLLPAAWAARVLSSDGLLSQPFLDSLSRAQRTLGWAFLSVGLATPLWLPLLRPLEHALAGMATPVFLFLLFTASVATVVVLQRSLLESVPHVTDETSHVFQAKIFVQGRLTAELPPCYRHFWQHNVIMSRLGRWHTKYYPGNALWIAWGERLGLPQLPIPIAWGLFLVLLTLFLHHLITPFRARCVALLSAASPMGVLLAASFMSHTTFLFYAMAAIYAMFRATISVQPKQRFWLYACAGFLLGMAAMTRPQDLAALGLLGVVALFVMPRQSCATLFRRGLVPGILGIVPPTLFLLAWNQACYGSFLGSGYNFGVNPSLTQIIDDRLGFSETFTPLMAFWNFLWTLLRFDSALYGWPSSLAPLALLVFVRPWKAPLAISLLALVIYPFMYFFFPYYAFEYEARYYAPLIPFVSVLMVAAIAAGDQLLRKAMPAGSARQLVGTLLLVFASYAVFYYWPHRIWPEYGNHYQQSTRLVRTIAEAHVVPPAIVLIDASGDDEFRYSAGFIFNDPDLRSDILYARDRGERNDCLKEHFPDRRIYRFLPEPDWRGGSLVEISE